MQPLRVVPRPSPVEPGRAPNNAALRRATVRAAVIAASVVIFSAAWVGIASEGPPANPAVQTASAVGPRLVQAPTKRRKVVVVRRSRAS